MTKVYNVSYLLKYILYFLAEYFRILKTKHIIHKHEQTSR